MIADLLWYASVLVAGAYSAFLLLCYARFRMLKPTVPAQEFTGSVTVVVAARNEESNIRNLLNALEQQECSFPFEVIIVDDASQDKTKLLAEAHWPKKFQLRVAANEGAGKKGALSTGIYLSHADVILVTDADGIPDKKWVQRMAEQFTDEQCCFVGGMIRPESTGSAIGSALVTEGIFLQFVSAGMFAMRSPVMCNGASMGFKRQFFHDVHGFSDDLFVSGDDVFLLMKAQRYRPNGIRWVKDNEAMVEAQVAETIPEAIAQRHRWLSKSKAYSGSATGMAGVLFLAVQLLLPAMLLCIPVPFLWYNPFVTAVLIKTGVELLLLSLAASWFRGTNAIIMLPLSVVIYCIISLGAVFRMSGGEVTWKGRTWRDGKVQ